MVMVPVVLRARLAQHGTAINSECVLSFQESLVERWPGKEASKIQTQNEGRDRSLPSLVCARFCRIRLADGLERLNVRSLPALGPLHHVELHGLTFLQALETARVDCRVVHEDVFTVLTRNKAEALRVIKPLHSTLFHFDRISWIELRWMNRSDHWQNLAWLGELLHTPGSALTLALV